MGGVSLSGGSDSAGITSPSYLFEAGLWEAGASQNPEAGGGNSAKDGCPFCPSFSLNILGLEFSLNLEASDTFTPQNTLSCQPSPFLQPHPWPRGHSPFCTPKPVISLHHLPVSHRLGVGGQPPGETELTEVAMVLRQGTQGQTSSGWLRDPSPSMTEHAPLGLGHYWAYPSEDPKKLVLPWPETEDTG